MEAADGVELADDGVDVPAQRSEVVALVQDDALLIEDECAAVASQVGGGCEAAVFVVVELAVEGAEAVGDRAVGVGDEGVGHALCAAIGLGGGEEPFVDVRGVGAAADEDGFAGLEVGEALLKGVDLRSADAGEVTGVEEQDHVLSAVAVEGELAVHLAVDNGGGGEFGGGVSEQGHGAKVGCIER